VTDAVALLALTQALVLELAHLPEAAALVDATAVCAAKKSIEASLSLSPYATLFA